MLSNGLTRAAAIVWCALLLGVASAQTPEPPEEGPAVAPQARMSPQRMAAIIQRIDPQASLAGNVWEFAVDGTSIALVFDIGADRMRLMLPVAKAEDLTDAMLLRLLQANFDTALDARYAIARDTLWATFIHPLSPLTDGQLLSAINQTVSIARSYGSTFSSGVWAFGGGDTNSGEAGSRPRSGT